MGFKPDLDDQLISTDFLQCFDTVGLVTWPVKIVPEMTLCVEWDVKPHTLTHFNHAVNRTETRLMSHFALTAASFGGRSQPSDPPSTDLECVYSTDQSMVV